MGTEVSDLEAEILDDARREVAARDDARREAAQDYARREAAAQENARREAAAGAAEERESSAVREREAAAERVLAKESVVSNTVGGASTVAANHVHLDTTYRTVVELGLGEGVVSIRSTDPGADWDFQRMLEESRKSGVPVGEILKGKGFLQVTRPGEGSGKTVYTKSEGRRTVEIVLPVAPPPPAAREIKGGSNRGEMKNGSNIIAASILQDNADPNAAGEKAGPPSGRWIWVPDSKLQKGPQPGPQPKAAKPEAPPAPPGPASASQAGMRPKSSAKPEMSQKPKNAKEVAKPAEQAAQPPSAPAQVQQPPAHQNAPSAPPAQQNAPAAAPPQAQALQPQNEAPETPGPGLPPAQAQQLHPPNDNVALKGRSVAEHVGQSVAKALQAAPPGAVATTLNGVQVPAVNIDPNQTLSVNDTGKWILTSMRRLDSTLGGKFFTKVQG